VPGAPEIADYSCDDKELAVTIAEAMKPCVKSYSDDLFMLSRRFGPVLLRFGMWRSTVCTRRVVAVEEVPEAVVAAHTREVIEWDCHPLLAPEASDAA